MKNTYSSDVFYTQFAQTYAQYAFGKKDYITAVNRFICKESISPSNILDVGSGDGKRAKTIADAIGVKNITLVDNSEGMVLLSKKITDATVIYADITRRDFDFKKKYDLVLCLWNVFGHIATENERIIAMKNLGNLLSDGGVLFIDVNNRYNSTHYGKFSVFRNLLKDLFLSKDKTGNFDLSFKADTGNITTKVHIFNPKEIEYLIKSAGLTVEKRIILNYKTGTVEENFWKGQLVYKIIKK
ncbi:MAG: class I SAM-dependent methyltransferase [bacterium]